MKNVGCFVRWNTPRRPGFSSGLHLATPLADAAARRKSRRKGRTRTTYQEMWSVTLRKSGLSHVMSMLLAVIDHFLQHMLGDDDTQSTVSILLHTYKYPSIHPCLCGKATPCLLVDDYIQSPIFNCLCFIKLRLRVIMRACMQAR